MSRNRNKNKQSNYNTIQQPGYNPSQEPDFKSFADHLIQAFTKLNQDSELRAVKRQEEANRLQEEANRLQEEAIRVLQSTVDSQSKKLDNILANTIVINDKITTLLPNLSTEGKQKIESSINNFMSSEDYVVCKEAADDEGVVKMANFLRPNRFGVSKIKGFTLEWFLNKINCFRPANSVGDFVNGEFYKIMTLRFQGGYSNLLQDAVQVLAEYQSDNKSKGRRT
jgi:hypothetical protein